MAVALTAPYAVRLPCAGRPVQRLAAPGWTYVVSDNPFGSEMERFFTGLRERSGGSTRA